MTTTATPRLALRDVGVEFPTADGARTVLTGIDLDVRAGEFVCIVGASGSGKTTLLRSMAGLIPALGTIAVDGTPIDGPSPASSFVFQSDALLPWRTVAANVALGLEVRGVGKAERTDRVGEALATVRLSDWADSFPRQLSGGMRQRVNIARALAQEPSILLMDEPFAALDAQTRELMQDELATLSSTHGWTVLFVTHQIDEAVFLGDRVVVLGASPGRVREIVDVELDRPRHVDDKRTAGFTAQVDHIWRLISDEVRVGLDSELRHR
ncbi:ABC transporter ATP-binding protein [Pseudonocardia nematodicida]|uniref:ABC transporter ATP-binding protein n=1 Tax=Pseudonocardia nematodicida TaxID=1206997 RepID=A0ABV1K4U8_9PSEU